MDTVPGRSELRSSPKPTAQYGKGYLQSHLTAHRVSLPNFGFAAAVVRTKEDRVVKQLSKAGGMQRYLPDIEFPRGICVAAGEQNSSEILRGNS